MSEREQEYLGRVAANPKDTLARYVLAKDYFDEQQYDRAAGHFRVLIEQKPDWMKCWIHLGQCLLAAGDNAEARPLLERALALAQEQHHEGPAADIFEMLRDL